MLPSNDLVWECRQSTEPTQGELKECYRPLPVFSHACLFYSIPPYSIVK
jgi:hypothetical protein